MSREKIMATKLYEERKIKKQLKSRENINYGLFTKTKFIRKNIFDSYA